MKCALEPIGDEARQRTEAASGRAKAAERIQAGIDEALDFAAALLDANQIGKRQLAAIALLLHAAGPAILIVVEQVVGDLKGQANVRPEVLERGLLLLARARHQSAQPKGGQE